MAVTRIISPLLQKTEKQQISKGLEAASIKCDLYKIQFYFSAFSRFRFCLSALFRFHCCGYT